MTLMMLIVTVVLLASANVVWWRTNQLYRTRWRLYALRDELRWAAYRDRQLLDSELFWKLDRSLTLDCGSLDEVSAWPMLPFLILGRPRKQLARFREELEEALNAPKHAVLKPIFEEARAILGRLLCTRHFITFLVLAVSVAFYVTAKRILERVRSVAKAKDVVAKSVDAGDAKRTRSILVEERPTELFGLAAIMLPLTPRSKYWTMPA